jgi:uncharacterized iron-regulated membrane protein
MKFDHPRGLRQSMSWVHTWSGLVLGWLLFAIFVTGTLSYFRGEITFWMQPELHRATREPVAFERILRVLEQEAPNATQWSITLPGPRNPTLGLSWQTASSENRAGRDARAGAGADGNAPSPSSRRAITDGADSAAPDALRAPDGERRARADGGERPMRQRQSSEEGTRDGGNNPRRMADGGQRPDGAEAALPQRGSRQSGSGESRPGRPERSERANAGETSEASSSPRAATDGADSATSGAFHAQGGERRARANDGERPMRQRQPGEEGARGGGNPRRMANGGQRPDSAEAGLPQRGSTQTGSPQTHNANANAPQRPQAQGGGGGGGGRGPRLVLDPASGEKLHARETAGGNFLYRFHYELHGMDRQGMDRSRHPGRWIVGIATMFMLVAIISGVIVHRNIFKDFFTFRPGKGKRSWLDAHCATSVLSLPFHIMITFSGLLLFGNMLFPSAMQSAYGDGNAYMQAMRGRMMAASATPKPSGERAALTGLPALIAAAENAWNGRPAGSITIINPGDRNAVVELRQARGESLAAGRNSAQTLRFNGVTGEPLDVAAPPSPSVVQSISNVFMMLHRGFFASPIPRWLLFLAGVGGSLMVASGLVIWSVSRAREEKKTGRVPFGHRLVEVTNIGGICGLLIAIGGYFWASRLIPPDLAGRSEWEISAFFYFWLASLVHALARKPRAAWVEQLAFAGALFALLPILNAQTGGLSLFGSIYLDQWLVAGFDLCALITGGALLYAARKVYRHVPRVRHEHVPAAANTTAPPRQSEPASSEPASVTATPVTPDTPAAAPLLSPAFPILQTEKGA